MDQKEPNGPELHLGGAPRGAQPTRARLGAQARPGGLCPPRWPPAPPVCSINTPIFQKPLGLTRGFLEYLGIYRAKRGCGRPPRWAQPTWACLGPQAHPGGLCSPRSSPQVLSWPNGCLLVQKKCTKHFAAFGLRLILISCDVKNKQKTATDTGHWVNRLVPKNDIKFL